MADSKQFVAWHRRQPRPGRQARDFRAKFWQPVAMGRTPDEAIARARKQVGSEGEFTILREGKRPRQSDHGGIA